MSEEMDKSTQSTAANTSTPESLTAKAEWERDLLNRLAFASLNEQRRARRWSTLFKFLILLYLVALLFIANPDIMGLLEQDLVGGEPHTALIEIQGPILAEEMASADRVVTGLRNAFEDEDTKGVILRINSPGGSAVQSGYINDEIHRLKEQHPEIPVYAVITDICASGGYYIAAGADEIYADKSSIVGSIGVIMSSFGFVDAIEKLGIERRVMTSGENKAFLDPFSPENETEKAHMQTLLDSIHQQFIAVVEKGRGDRLNADAKEQLFSGLVWTGEQALELGLVDALGSSSYVAREVIQAENIVNYTPKFNFWEEFSGPFGEAMMNTFAERLAEEFRSEGALLQ